MVATVTHARQIRDVLIAWAEQLQPAPFDEVMGAEPKVPPSTTGIVCTITEAEGRVLPDASTLAGVAMEYRTAIHLFRKLNLTDPTVDEDSEPDLTDARDTLVALLMADIALRNLTLAAGQEWAVTGTHGAQPLSWGPGYLDFPGGETYRTQTIQLPAIVWNAHTPIR